MKHNLSTDVDPTPNHAERHGYEQGSMWRNRVTGRTFVCVDPSDKGAEWAPIGEAAAPEGGLAKVAYSGDFNDLTRAPRLGQAAGLDVGDQSGQVAAGDDKRINGALQADRNLDDLTDPEKARRNLGFGDLILRLLTAGDEGLDELHKRLGLGDVARNSEISRLQPKSEALTHLAGIKFGTAGTDLMRAETAEAVAKWLGLVLGETVQRWSEVLDRLARMEPAILGLVTSPNLAAVREGLELTPGQAYGPPADLRDTLAAMRRDIDALKAWTALAADQAVVPERP